jgi:hypothetical protein
MAAFLTARQIGAEGGGPACVPVSGGGKERTRRLDFPAAARWRCAAAFQAAAEARLGSLNYTEAELHKDLFAWQCPCSGCGWRRPSSKRARLIDRMRKHPAFGFGQSRTITEFWKQKQVTKTSWASPCLQFACTLPSFLPSFRSCFLPPTHVPTLLYSSTTHPFFPPFLHPVALTISLRWC